MWGAKMSSIEKSASVAVQQGDSWTDAPQSPANDIGQKSTISLSAADAFGAMADAVTAYIAAPQRLKDRRAAVMSISTLLREAFSLRSEVLTPLPKQLGANHDVAADYIYEQLDRWAAQPSLKTLFKALSVQEDVQSTVILSTMRRVPAEQIGMWLTTEFGDLSTSREAEHARRYVATKLTAAIFDLSKAQPSIALDNPNALQFKLDDWAAPTGAPEQSLHYQMVVAPFLSFFHEIATGRIAGSVS